MSVLEPLFASPWPWVIGGAILIGLEIVAPGVFLLWMGLGAIAVGLSVLVAPDLPLPWQLLVFAIAMLGSIMLGFAIQRRSRVGPSAAGLNREREALVGREVEAIQTFQGGRGRVRVGDSSYTATCAAPVAAGQMVRISGVDADGTLHVDPAEPGRHGVPAASLEKVVRP